MQAIFTGNRPYDSGVFGRRNPNGGTNLLIARASLALLVTGAGLAVFERYGAKGVLIGTIGTVSVIAAAAATVVLALFAIVGYAVWSVLTSR